MWLGQGSAMGIRIQMTGLTPTICQCFQTHMSSYLEQHLESATNLKERGFVEGNMLQGDQTTVGRGDWVHGDIYAAPWRLPWTACTSSRCIQSMVFRAPLPSLIHSCHSRCFGVCPREAIASGFVAVWDKTR
jgi:hypothetical protein